MLFEERKPRLTVRTEWMRLWPRRGHHQAFWLAVARRVRERRVRHADVRAIKDICEEVEHEFVLSGR